jgi:hypothetical protein
MTQPEPLESVLLTGAGFTKNFEGFLACEMRTFICERLRNRPDLMTIFQDELDYELAYTKVIYGDFDIADKKIVRNAVEATYVRLDDAVRRLTWTTGLPPVNIYRLKTFLGRFGHNPRQPKGRGYFFTLNHDLFVERWCGVGGGDPLFHLHGQQRPPLNFHSNPGRTLNGDDVFTVPSAEKMEKIRQNDDLIRNWASHFHYVKLHGSFNWRSSDGKLAMVVGGKKLEQLRKEPLLSYYLETFEDVLSCQNRRLCVIGYGFGDDHINAVISNGIRDHGLKLFTITAMRDEDLKTHLHEKTPNGLGGTIWRGIQQNFQCGLKELYPWNGEPTQFAKSLESSLFD